MKTHALVVAARTALMALLLVAVPLVGAAEATPSLAQSDAALVLLLLSARSGTSVFDELSRGDQRIDVRCSGARRPMCPDASPARRSSPRGAERPGSPLPAR